MSLQKVIDYCSQKKGATREFPFDDTTLVFKVMNKMFCLINLTEPYSINLKCDPVYAVAIRQKHPAVTPGYHMNKKHWNTVQLDQSIGHPQIFEWIDDSYDLIVAGLKKSDRDHLASL